MLEKLEKYITDREILAVIAAALITSIVLILFSSVIVPMMILITFLIAIYLIYTRIREINEEIKTLEKEVK